MGIPVLVLGRSGTGKTTALRNFKNGEIGHINVLGKTLPFKADFKSFVTDDYTEIKKALMSSKVDTVIIDDAGYLITNQFMRGHGSGLKGNAVFELYNDIADNFWDLIRFVQVQLPEEKVVYFLMHEDKNEMGDVKPKTIGKMLDDKVCVEGLFTIVLRTMKKDGKYVIRTTSDGYDVTKAPIDMFEGEEIENDLKKINEIIFEYYNLKGAKADA